MKILDISYQETSYFEKNTQKMVNANLDSPCTMNISSIHAVSMPTITSRL